MDETLYQKCPRCHGHGVIDHVNLTGPGPAITTEKCGACRHLHVVPASRTPGPATRAILEWAQGTVSSFGDSGHRYAWTYEMLDAFLAEWPAGA